MNEQEPLSADAEMSEDVADLLERRSTYREWLNRLEEMKDEVSPEVYRPVEEDYRVRLGRVDEELAQHREGLQRALQERQSRHSEMTARRDELVRELDEAELRHRVGELGEGEWEEFREERREEITELDRSLEEEWVAVEEIREILRAMKEEPPAAGEAAGGEYVDEEWERGEPAFEEEGGWEGPATEGREEAAAVDEPEEWEFQPEDELEGEGEPEFADEPGWEREEAVPTAEEGAPEAEAPEEEGLEALEEEGGEMEAEAPEGEALEALEEEALEEEASEEEAGAEEAADEEEYYDELEFLESLSLDDTERFDAVSSMLDEEEDEEEGNGEDEDR